MTKSSQHENLDERLLHRLLFFTDAVFAIVLTILVLELRAPETIAEATLEHLVEAAPHIGIFVFSFFIVGVFWLAHMNTTRRLAAFDWPSAFANLLFLGPICLLPYATGWLGANPGGDVAWSFYCWTLVAISAANIVLVLTTHRGAGRLLAGGASGGEVFYRSIRAAVPGAAFAGGLLLMEIGQSTLARFCWVLILPLFFATRLVKPKAA